MHYLIPKLEYKWSVNHLYPNSSGTSKTDPATIILDLQTLAPRLLGELFILNLPDGEY